MAINFEFPTSVAKSIGKYKAMGISIELMEVTGSTLKFRSKQIRKDTDRVLAGKELHDRAKEALNELYNEYTVHILPVIWSGPEIENVSASWVLAKMAKHHLRQKDLQERLNIDKHVISKLLKNEFGFTRWHKAAFYYLFLHIEDSKDLFIQLINLTAERDNLLKQIKKVPNVSFVSSRKL